MGPQFLSLGMALGTIGKGAITLMAQQPMSHVAIASATEPRT